MSGVETGSLSGAHAKALASLAPDRQAAVATQAVSGKWSAHELERAVKADSEQTARAEKRRAQVAEWAKSVAAVLSEKAVAQNAMLYVSDKDMSEALVEAGWPNRTTDYPAYLPDDACGVPLIGRHAAISYSCSNPPSLSFRVTSSGDERVARSATGKFSTAGSMSRPREEATATALPNGKVLVAGGANQKGIEASAEMFDPATGKFNPAGSMANARSGHTATLLPDGRVLIAGGQGLQGSHSVHLASCELYDPGTGTFGPAGSMVGGRSYHSAVPLVGGRVLVLGGSVNLLVDASHPELYDPITAQFSATGSIGTALTGRPAVVALTDGRVLVAGGQGADDYSTASAELYQP